MSEACPQLRPNQGTATRLGSSGAGEASSGQVPGGLQVAGAQAHPQGSGAASVAGRGFTCRATVPAPVEILAGRNYPHTQIPFARQGGVTPSF